MTRTLILRATLCLVGLGAAPAAARVHVQCPGDLNGDAIVDVPDPDHPNARCMHLGAGDGYAVMADGRVLYTFGFVDLTGMMPQDAMNMGMLAAHTPAPTIEVGEGDELYLTLTNVGMMIRPDLFDPHTVHWHGFPEAAPVFDGQPDSAIAINMGSSLTYYYRVVEPGTYMYHCHVEATEHMQMGMLGNLYVRSAQDKAPPGTVFGAHVHAATDRYAYDDGDGSTRYDVDFPIQIGSFDPDFHDANENIQPLPFANIRDRYPLLNGRGYPDTVNPNPLPPPEQNGFQTSQSVSSLIAATAGQRVLLRISNLNVTRFYTLATTGLPMRVVGLDARLLRGPTGQDLTYVTRSVTLGGGESADVIIDTTGVAPGTYFLYTTNLQYLSNDGDDMGGMMTEIVIGGGV